MSKKIKILYIEPCPLNFGGYYRSIEICQALSRSNIKVDLLISSDKKISPLISKITINKNLSIYILPRYYLSAYISGHILRGVIATLFGLFGDYDIVQASSPVQPESNIPLTILKLFGKKIVVSWEDIWTDGVIPFNKIVTQYLKFWENNSPRFFENIICISQILVNRAKKLGAKNILKLINGTNIYFYCPNQKLSLKKLKLNTKFKYLLIFGNTFEGQRAYLTILTFQKILSLSPQTKLITNFDLRKQIANHPKIKNILPSTFNNIINAGYISNELLPHYLAASDIILFIMGNSLNEKACFPIRISKILSSESIIAIQENYSETTSTLKKYNCALIDTNLDRLALKTVDYFTNKKLQNKLHAQVIYAKNALNWDKLVIPLISLYKKII